MITIVGYGLGNVRAFSNIYKNHNIDVRIAQSPDELSGATKLILPGVGAFDWAMDRLTQSGMLDALNDLVIVDKVPVLGVCVGMQMMAKSSEEGNREGLGWVDARVVRLYDNDDDDHRLPHMGWNSVYPVVGNNDLFKTMDEHPGFYFLHSYVLAPADQSIASATTEHGPSFTCAIQSGNVFGTQFHPEKSHSRGERLLLNFASL